MEEKHNLFKEHESLLALFTDDVQLIILKVPSWISERLGVTPLLDLSLLIRKMLVSWIPWQ